MTDVEPNTPVRTLDWGVRRADGGITMSSEGWARDVHRMVGLPLVRFDAVKGSWIDAA